MIKDNKDSMRALGRHYYPVPLDRAYLRPLELELSNQNEKEKSMKIQPTQDNVAVMMDKKPELKNGIALPSNAREPDGLRFGKCIAVGEGRCDRLIRPTGENSLFIKPPCAVGDRVTLRSFSVNNGSGMKGPDDSDIVIVSGHEILAVIAE